jgi:putative FmdB family regulatory protein
MPIYEYACQDCHGKSSVLVLNPRNPSVATCRHCGGSRMERLLSRFAAPKSEEARLESLSDPANLGGIDENDPRSVARLMKKMGQEMGEDVDDIEAMMNQSDDGSGMPEGGDGL